MLVDWLLDIKIKINHLREAKARTVNSISKTQEILCKEQIGRFL
jgi:hypothetical protein